MPNIPAAYRGMKQWQQLDLNLAGAQSIDPSDTFEIQWTWLLSIFLYGDSGEHHYAITFGSILVTSLTDMVRLKKLWRRIATAHKAL